MFAGPKFVLKTRRSHLDRPEILVIQMHEAEKAKEEQEAKGLKKPKSAGDLLVLFLTPQPYIHLFMMFKL